MGVDVGRMDYCQERVEYIFDSLYSLERLED